MKSTVVIPNYNGMKFIENCMKALAKETSTSYHICVVDNGSEDGSREWVEKNCPRVQVIALGENTGFCGAVNAGIKAADSDYVILLNNDTEVITANWMEELLMYAQREDVGAVGAKLLYPDKTIQHAGVVIGLGAHRTAGHSHYKMPQQNLGYMGRLCYAQNMSAVTGACLMVKKSLYEQVGGLEETFEISLNVAPLPKEFRNSVFAERKK